MSANTKYDVTIYKILDKTWQEEENNQKILNKSTFTRAIMSHVNILVSTPSPASIPLPAVVSSLATAKKHCLHIKGGKASIQIS